MRWILGLSMLLTAPLALADAVGMFTEVHGQVRLQRDNSYYDAAVSVEVQASDLVETGPDAGAQLELHDGTVLRLGANSQLLLSDYQLASDGSVLRAGVEVLAGWLRFAVAKLHGDDRRFDIGTPTMTIGIRGTEGVIEAGNDQGGLNLEEGRVAVRAVGESAGASGGETVEAGQYIERRSGRAFLRPGAAPRAFLARWPAALRARAVRHPQLLRQRGVPPRFVRQLRQEERERYLREHPHLRQQLERRFHDRVRDGGRAANAPERPARALAPREKQEWQQRRREELKKREELRRHRREPESNSGAEPTVSPVAAGMFSIA